MAARVRQLRIAVPSWGMFTPPGGDPDDGPKVSREEMLSIFEGDLRSGAEPSSEDRRQKEVSRRLRQALYPGMPAATLR